MKAAPGRTSLYATLSIVVVVALLVSAVPGHGVFLSPAQKCRLGKLKAAGKYEFCRIKVMAKSLKFGAPPDFERCDKKFERKWVVLEEKAIAKGIPCPTEDDYDYMQTRLINFSGRIEDALLGVRFVDHGDGTTTDTVTGLMWEQKQAGSGCLHCADDSSNWIDLAEWLSLVNGHTDDPDAQVGLGGHSDWRLPNIAELKTLPIAPLPADLGPLPGAPPPFRFWSSTTSATSPTAAWFLDFDDGVADVGGKMGAGVYYRAVRGGL